METIPNSKGGVKLCHDGYMFTKKGTNKTTIRWECSKRRAMSCKGAIVTDLQIERVLSSTDHTHESDINIVNAARVRATMKDNAVTNKARPGQIVADALQDCPVEVRVAMGKLDSIKRSIRRQKRGNLPKEPATLRDFVINAEWSTTGTDDDEQFLIYDSGPESYSRAVVFASEQGLQHLCRSNTWFMDGTFSSSPKIFKQLYVIRAPLGNSAVTCVYAFLSCKTQSIYEELFSAIIDKCSELGYTPDPTTVITDFEQAVFNALRATFGQHVNSRGCFYHLTQSTWRKIQELGLTELYKTDEKVRLFCGMLDGLAFLPVEEVPTGMNCLKDNTPAGLEELVDYFDSTYVSGTYRRVQPPPSQPGGVLPPVRMRRIPPMFPIQLWNVHQPTLENEDRTNNMCESWNFGFQQLIGHNHPSVWTAIDCLRKDQAIVAAALLADSRGAPPTKRVKRATRNLQDRLRNMCVDIASGRKNVEDFLHGVGHCIRFKVRI